MTIDNFGKSDDFDKSNKFNKNDPLKAELKKTWLKTTWRFLLYGVIGLLLAPVVLLLIYRIPATKPISTLMLNNIVMSQDYQREWVDIDDIAPMLRFAVTMSEDGKFCHHDGIDWQELGTVILKNGGPTRGASTITMQMVKNLFLWNDRSYLRKTLEIPYALIADLILPKKRIMEIYLNIAEWGPNIYGIEAASQHYFKRSAKNLTSRQAAYLAITLPNPKGRNAAKPNALMKKLAIIIENRARQSGAYVDCIR